MFDNGLRVPKNEAKALGCFREAASLGQAEAQYAMARRYEQGVGVEQDLEEGVDLCERAAQKDIARHSACDVCSGRSRYVGFLAATLGQDSTLICHTFATYLLRH